MIEATNIINDKNSTFNNDYIFENFKVIQLRSEKGIFQRIPTESSIFSKVYANAGKDVPVYYSTTAYLVAETFDLEQIPLQRTSEYCLANFAFQQNCVLDFDCEKDSAKNPVEKSLNELTAAVVGFVQNLQAAGFRLNKDFFVYFTGRAGYRLVIPAEVIGADFECGQFAAAENAMKRLANAIIARYSSEMNLERLMISLDNASFTKDRIMLAGYSVNPKAGGILSFFLDDADVKANISLDMIREKSNAIEDGRVSKIDFSEVSLEKNETLSALFEECRTSSTSFHEEKKENIRNKKSHTKTGPGNQNGWSCTDNDKKSPPGEWKPFYRLKNKPVSAFDCHCMKYFLENCNNLELAGESRFEYCLIMAILATKLDDRDGLKAFYKKVAEKNRPGQDTEKTAEEWTLETYNSLKNRPISCKNIISKKAEGEAGKSIVDYLNEKFEFEGEAGFRCNMNCPLYPKAALSKPDTAALNIWALDYIFTHKIIAYTNDIYKYDENSGYYVKISDPKIEKSISEFLNIHYTEAKKKNIISKIKSSAAIVIPAHAPDELCLNNGILNVNSNILQPHTYRKHFFGKIDACYDPNGPEPQSEAMDKFLESMFPGSENKERLDVLMEFLGYTLTTTTHHQVALLMTSNGSSGKSTLARIWLKILSELGKSLDAITKVIDTRWGEDLKNRTLCYVDEINSTELMSDGILKSRISGGAINYDTKYEKTGSFESTVKFIFGSNIQGVNTADFSHGFMRRFIIMEFPVNFDDPQHARNKVLDIERLIVNDPAAKNRLFYLALEGLKRLNARGHFEISKDWKKRQRELLQSNNVYFDFARNHLYYQSNSRSMRTEIYRHAAAYAKENGKLIGSARKFWSEIARVAKCLISPEIPGTLFFRSNGHDYISDVVIKGMRINEKGRIECITPENSSTCGYGRQNQNLIVNPEDVSIVEMPYQDYVRNISSTPKAPTFNETLFAEPDVQEGEDDDMKPE